MTNVDRPGQAVQLRMGEYLGVLEEAQGEGTGKGRRRSGNVAGLQPGDVIQVRLLRQDRQKHRWVATMVPAPMVQGALFSMELRTGKVRVVMGGKDFADSSFNRATQARRQSGSAFKPIIYAAAIEKGYGPNSIIQDAPLSLPGGKRGQEWSPQNYDHSYTGPITLATAIARSRNVPAVRMMMALGIPAVVKMAKTLGITSTIYPYYSSALGASEVTLMELTRAYSVFPAQGYLLEPVFIDRIEDRDGRVLWEATVERKLVMNPQSANTMTQLLVGVVRGGTATRVQVLKRPLGGKTGTTNRHRDAWFIGFTPSLITGVWVGMDDERTLGGGETGSAAAAPIFIAYMKEALKNLPVEDFPAMPSTVLAKKGKKKPVEDDEEATEGDETFYPEDKPITDGSPPSTPSPQKFYKDDLEG